MQFSEIYIKNMKFFKNSFPEVYSKISNSNEEKQFNLVKSAIGDVEFYNIEEKESKYLAYQQDPYLQAQDYAQKALQQDHWLIYNNEDKSNITNIDKMIFISSGLGYTLNAYNEKYDLKSILLIEPNLEIFTYSCHVVDYEELAQGKQLEICLDLDNLKAQVISFYNSLFFYNTSVKVGEFLKNEVLYEVSVILSEHLKENPLYEYVNFNNFLNTKTYEVNAKEIKILLDKFYEPVLDKADIERIVYFMAYIAKANMPKDDYSDVLRHLSLFLFRLTVNVENSLTMNNIASYCLSYLTSQAKMGNISRTFYLHLFNNIITGQYNNKNLKAEFLEECISYFKQNYSLEEDLIGKFEYHLNVTKGNKLSKSTKEYICSEFNEFAETFENSLVNVLSYSAHKNLVKYLFDKIDTSKKYNILDIGCGTGLVGKELKAIAEVLVGVDLSSNMLKEAQKKEVYTDLVEDEIENFLEKQAQNSFDIITSTDVFIYIGELEKTFEKSSKVLKEGGLLTFSIELEENRDVDYHLNGTGRFSQSENYIKRLASENGFEILTSQKEAIRKEKKDDVQGMVFILKKA